MTVLEVLVTPTFAKAVKKLHAKDKAVVDKAVKAVASNPAIGEEKKGDLAGIFVYKFKINKQEILLAYQLHPTKLQPVSVILLSMGSHENFYTDLKRLN
ncbi:type II toxin-antitoxin system RelE/ParE family toxin [Janthinobacterium sp. Mn2066]|uniref:type II toxin-antitoxin system RelE/ParE family toxin n=1 Tax=Janthinobacterium sp. Mn2066 TaxID=3395264 RepID=UPI003BBE858A